MKMESLTIGPIGELQSINILQERTLQESGVRHLLVDITPEILRSHLDSPLSVSVTEILPISRDRGIISDIEVPTVILNSETHELEPVPAQLSQDIEDHLVHYKDRSGKVVLLRGLSLAFKRLKNAVFQEGRFTELGEILRKSQNIDFFADPDLDPNRYSVDLFQNPENVLEEMMRNYERLVLSRYPIEHTTMIDCHADPVEQSLTVRPHVILGRTNLEHKDEIYVWATSNFPAFSVVWDVAETEYYKRRLNKSFADALLRYIPSVTLECTGGLGNDEISTNNAVLGLIETFKILGILTENQINEWKYMLSIESEIVTAEHNLIPANKFYPGKQLRREILQYNFDRGLFHGSALFRPDIQALGSHLSSGDRIGEIRSTQFDFEKDEYARQVLYTKHSGVLLGFPAENILHPTLVADDIDEGIILITMAVPEDE